MDPDAALANMRAAIAAYNGTDPDDSVDWNDVQAIVESADALDQWLSKGGFLPAAWAR